LGIKSPAENNFKGNVFFLIDGRSFSASAEFAAVARSNNRGLFIGEETGGGYYGNTSGDEKNITLPNTNITVRIPMVKYVSAVKKAKYSDRGVIPDYISFPDLDYFIQHSDIQLEYALKIANNK
jgi:C-terminal processing protease CtpA/Prc